MRKADWDLMFLSDSPYRYKTFRRKLDKRAYPSVLEFGLKHGLTLPGGLNPGQQVALLLDEIALPYYDLKSFDDLPTPYRCVATDLRKGEAVVIDKPPLARAMRATMAIPGVFTPVNWGDWLLVDGGALNNIPADVVRSMGADIVIAVNVGADPTNEEETQTLFAMLGKTIDTMMSTNSRRSLAAADYVIDPDLKGFNSGSWRQSDGLADRGFAAAESLADKLKAYAISPEEHAAFMAARQAKRRHDVPTPTFISVQGSGGSTLTPSIEQQITRDLTPALNTPVVPADMRERILSITGTDRFEYLTYSLTDTPKPTGLDIGVRPKSYGPPFLMVGLDLNNIDSTNFAFNLSARMLHYGLFGKDSETRVEGILGTHQRFAAEFLKPLFGTDIFIAPRAYFDRQGRNVYVDNDLAAEYRIKRTGAGIDIGKSFGRKAEVRLGYDDVNIRGRRRIGSPDLPEAEGRESFASLNFAFDNQSSPIVPTRGVRSLVSLRQYFDAPDPTVHPELFNNDDQYTLLEGGTSWFRTVRATDRFFVRGEGGTTFGARPLIDSFTLGGPLRLGAYNNDELHGDNYALGVGGYLLQVGRMPDVLGGNVFAGGWVETGAAFNDWDGSAWKTNATAGIIIESFLGPIFGGISAPLKGGHVRFYVSLGPLFR
jgi:NTE family protein